MTTRRTFLSASSLAALAAVSRPSRRLNPAFLRIPTSGALPDRLPRANDPDLHALAMRALDAAKGAGATYADVRFTTTRRRTVNYGSPFDESESSAVGVRVLAKGAWGFSAASEWTADGVARLGRTAVEQAKGNAWAGVPPIELGTRPPTAKGSWQTPIKRDPFTVPIAEMHEPIDIIQSFKNQPFDVKTGTTKIYNFQLVLTFERQDRTFASTEDAYVTQSIYTAFGAVPNKDVPSSRIVIGGRRDPMGRGLGLYPVPDVSPTGAGFEAVEALKIRDNFPAWLEKALDIHSAKPFQALGEYDVVFDAYTMASLVSGTFGVPTEYDRVVGYEANAGGTSYLAPPSKILGTSVAPSMVTITADRTLPTGAATVQWDDDGVTPRPTPLIKDGVIVDYATNREFATELASWYQKHGVSVQSNGCAASENALNSPVIHTPNLVLSPGPDSVNIETLLSGIERGFAIFNGDIKMDMQGLSGRGTAPAIYPIKHGRLGLPLLNAAFMFKSKDIWNKNLVALGGAQTSALRGLINTKGQPQQSATHTVNAVAARFKDLQIEPRDSQD